ncbi:MAG TPA: hypothetical protein VFJ78_03870 [Gaiellaceae bacterium]|nr:hypothetical protein [Gaiellaceae bacterium]
MRGLPFVVASLAALAIATASQGAAPRWIVFSGEQGTNTLQQLYRIDTTGGGLKQLTTGSLPAVSPSFAPNGNRIAFTRLGSGIYTMNTDGSGVRRLTSNGRDSYAVWSPDGKRIAFTRVVGANWRLFTMTADGKQQHRLAGAPPAGRPSWSKDGKSIFIPSAGDLVRVDSVTGKIQTYYGMTLDVQTGQTIAVSPSGKQAAFVAPRLATGPPDCGEGRCQQFGLYLANVPAPHRMRKLRNDTGAPGWSPDGSSIVYAAKGVLTVRNVRSGAERAIATGAATVIGDAPPAWQPR